MPCPQARYFMLTIPYEDFTPYLPPRCEYIRGQLEMGNQTGYLHWQVCAYYKPKVSLNYMKLIFGTRAHIEMTRGPAASEYVWKEDTRIQGTQFELGKLPVNRADPKD